MYCTRTPLGTDDVRQIVDQLCRVDGVDGVAVFGTMLEGRDVRFRSTIPHGTASPVLGTSGTGSGLRWLQEQTTAVIDSVVGTLPRLM